MMLAIAVAEIPISKREGEPIHPIGQHFLEIYMSLSSNIPRQGHKDGTAILSSRSIRSPINRNSFRIIRWHGTNFR